jgi:DinB superfamily
MKKSDIKTVPEFFNRYIGYAPDIELLDSLPTGGIELFQDNLETLQELGQQTYATDKWSIQQMVEHIMDTERIFLNRILRFARNDKTDLPGYDENHYANAARSNEIPLPTLLEQYAEIRRTAVSTFSNFNEEELMRSGTANGYEISVLAMGFILIGHPIHHYNIVKERYYPLIGK